MPAAVWVPAVAGLVGAGGSMLAQRSASKSAQRSQEQANREALTFEREREAERKRQFEARERALSPYRLGGYSVLAKYFGPEAVEASMAEDPETPEMRAARALDEVSRSRPNPYSLENLATRRPYGL